MSSTPRDDAATAVEPAVGDTRAEQQGIEQASAGVMALLSQHVPLALLADLAQRDGPSSPTILEDEGLPDVAWWE